ncbi:uncharacterized protein BX664DRAFT_344005 [Halteromyces radiatus]|uniref:uncharacterized protein n=1 Tax=Halteromyces radiatus TaxID=101107 RepID=UPI00221F7155|nr:uncharacterized protein BX664DRAFT_344005 [Halteromyces radiatus]KAI8076815.1 hypothetical protein BX664DRAFT_344005 [Halteromyces radiatus]
MVLSSLSFFFFFPLGWTLLLALISLILVVSFSISVFVLGWSFFLSLICLLL